MASADGKKCVTDVADTFVMERTDVPTTLLGFKATDEIARLQG